MVRALAIGAALQKKVETLDSVVIRFAGDSGDGMQLTGTQFTDTAALAGNDLATFPDYPAEIRAPAGTLAGVSAFQVHISDHQVFTPGDEPDVLVAMNPAALRANLADLKSGGVIILNTEAFTKKNIERAGYTTDPRENSLSGYQVIEVDITGIALKAVEGLGLTNREAVRCKNFFALGLVYWMYNRDLDHTLQWIEQKFGKKPVFKEANQKALKAGYNYGETTEVFDQSYRVESAQLKAGHYRNVSGNEALAFGLMAAAELSGLPLMLGSYPITPASTILHYLAKYKDYGVRTVQAEDEIAAACAAIGAAYGGALAVTTTSGPGLALKGEAMGLALSLELPLVIVDVQRGGPSTGLPTKTEQADLMMALYGRNGESPMPVVAAKSPADCFWAAIEASRIALRHMTPVLLLSDGSLANGAEPWRIPKLSELEKIDVQFRTDPEGFQPYARNADLGRDWAVPGTPGLEHRIGGLEKDALTGNVSYDPMNHEHMCKTRAEKVTRVQAHIPPTEIFGADKGDLLVLGWGGTFGAIREATSRAQKQGLSVSHVHLRHLNPMPKDLGDILGRFDKVLIPELNLGQLVRLIRAEYLVDALSYTKMQGKPFKVSELLSVIKEHLGHKTEAPQATTPA